MAAFAADSSKRTAAIADECSDAVVEEGIGRAAEGAVVDGLDLT